MDTRKLKVVTILPEAKDTNTIFLETADGRPLEYQAGQFLTFLLHFQGKELRRSYSLSSVPGVDRIPSITVKRVENGAASRYLLDHLKVGDELEALPPAGRFVLTGMGPEEHEATNPATPDKRHIGMSAVSSGREIFFIAAGSGMAPVFPLLQMALMAGKAGRVVLISQHRDEASILFREQLEQLVAKYGGRFRWVNLLSQGQATVGIQAAAINARLNNWLLEDLLGKLLMEGGTGSPDVGCPLFYLCGPAAFMRMAQFTIRSMGFRDLQIRKEIFTVEYVPPPPLLADTTPKKVIIHPKGSEGAIIEFETTWPKTILQAALDNHIQLPYSCKGGRCSTCTARCLSGKVKMSINEVLTEKDLLDGLVLTCVGYAETEVELAYSLSALRP